MTKVWPSVDILLVTYNHSDYIQRALESINYQEYAARVRLVVADDCSSDETVDIIRRYIAEHPGIECDILVTPSNLGITKNYKRGFEACTADYVAVIEGDDYWSSTRKLSKQIKFLEEHRECTACSSNCYIADDERFLYKPRMERSDGFLLLTPRLLIYDNLIGNFSTCVYRKSVIDRLPAHLFEIRAYDWILNICASMHGPIGYLCEPLSVYQQHPNGVWSSSPISQKLREQHQLIPQYNELTGRVFAKEFDELSARLEVALKQLSPKRSSKRSAVKRIAREIGRIGRTLDMLTPPILKWIVKGLIPPLAARAIARFVH